MAACCGKSKRADGDAEDIARQTRTCPANEIQLTMMHKIMDEIGEAAKEDESSVRKPAKAKAKAQDAKGDGSDDEEIKRSEQMQNALITTAKLWPRDKSSWTIGDVAEENRGHTRLSTTTGGQKAAKRAQKKQNVDPYVTQARAYIDLKERNVAAWWRKHENGEKKPTAEQRKFLESVIRRCKVEEKELRAWGGPASQKREQLSEPARMALLGIPGAGKSHCIHLLRDFLRIAWVGPTACSTSSWLRRTRWRS